MKQPVDSTLPRVAIFIVKSDIEVFVWFVVKVRISILSVGATTGRPRSYRLSLHIRLRSISIVGVDVPATRGHYRSPPHIRLLLKSVIYRSLLLWEKVPRNEADEEGVKGRCAMEKFVYVTDTSSTASGPLDVCEANSTVACDMLPHWGRLL